MNPSRYDTLPIPESILPIMEKVERLVNPSWLHHPVRDQRIRNKVRVWTLYTLGGVTFQAIAQHIGVTLERVRQIASNIQHALDSMETAWKHTEFPSHALDPDREPETIIDDRIHATHMIVSDEDHDAIEQIENGDRLSFQIKTKGMAQGRRQSWNGVDDNKPMFGHANEDRLQRQWYDRIRKAYWYDPHTKTVHERA